MQLVKCRLAPKTLVYRVILTDEISGNALISYVKSFENVRVKPLAWRWSRSRPVKCLAADGSSGNNDVFVTGRRIKNNPPERLSWLMGANCPETRAVSL